MLARSVGFIDDLLQELTAIRRSGLNYLAFPQGRIYCLSEYCSSCATLQFIQSGMSSSDPVEDRAAAHNRSIA